MQAAGVSEAASRGILARVIVQAIPRFIPGATPETALGLANALLDELYAGGSTVPETPAAVTPTLAGPLVDPNPAKFTQAYIDANSRYEECSQEEAERIIVRFRVFIPSKNKWWILSSIGRGHVSKEPEGGGLRCDDFTFEGYHYHIRGGRRNSDGNKHTRVEDMDVQGNRHLPVNIYAECRVAT